DKDIVHHILLLIQSESEIFKLAELKEELISYLNFLLLEDHNKLVHLLYRVDVDEDKLRKLLEENKEKDAAVIIADLLIQRQMEKASSNSLFKPGEQNSSEERW
ncbi:MAG: hypothetical protein H0U44_11755, partial [Flavisolibacter sp.]|nr:hypothetical protein [Flavisolibacter sp.]